MMPALARAFAPTLILLLLMAAPRAMAQASATGPASLEEKDLFVGPRVAPSPFELNGRLRRNVDFWMRIYSEYYTYQGVIHDSKYIGLIYEVVDLRELGGTRKVREVKRRWRDLLLAVHRKQAKPESMTPEEKALFEKFQGIDEPNKFLGAAHRKRLRLQLGQKDRFLEGLRESGRFLSRMEEIFKAEGLPLELTRLPFVESSFNTRARSKVGASGIWQFMRATGRLFLSINDAVDERNDPIRATEAAAQLLKINYDSLRSWPLAVTAYNHGRQGMMRAVRKTGSDDLEQLVDDYRSRSFGFASSNFFACLVAAVELEKNSEKYFGKVERATSLPTAELELPAPIKLPDLVRFMKVDRDRLEELNPAFSSAVLRGTRPIPGGYRLRIPHDGKISDAAAAQVFLAGFAEIPEPFKRSGQFLRNYGRRISSGKSLSQP